MKVKPNIILFLLFACFSLTVEATNQIPGCMNPGACNFDSNATEDDGSCIFPHPGCECVDIPGCTNPNSANYNPDATCDDNSCFVIGIPGCPDPNACNYNPNTYIDDGSCEYGVVGCPDPCNAILGCTDPGAMNYNPLATCDDGTCVLGFGCTDPVACNYDAAATVENGTCNYPLGGCECGDIIGCYNPCAANYNPVATCDDGSCFSIIPISGCTDPTACNYDPSIFTPGCPIQDDGTCEYGVVGCPDPCNAILGCVNPCNPNSIATCDDGSCFLTPGCTDPTACNYDPWACPDDGSCEYGIATVDCTDPCTATFGCPGSMNPDCPNYNPLVTCINYDCEPFGCTDPLACNYNPCAIPDDGSCYYAPAGCECNEPIGCTNPLADNYNPDATCDDASCEFSCNDIDLELQAFILTGSSSFYEGEPMSYTISLCNVGDCTAYDVSFGETSMSNFSVDSTNMDLTNNGTIWSLDSLEFFSCINLKVYGSFGLAGNYTTIFEVVDAQQNDEDSTPNNGAMEDDIDDLSIEIIAAPDADVWPGDANNDGVANNFDVLDIGLIYGNTGPARTNASTTWEAQAADNWTNYFDNGVNYKHTDCDGNGTIETEDVDVVGLNYGLTHGKKTSTTADGFPIWVEIPDIEIESGMLVSFPIHLGNDEFLLDDLYGVAFNLAYDEGLFELGTVEIDFSNSWFGPENVEMIGLGYAIGPTSVDIGVSRINQVNVNGTGTVAAVSGIIDDIAGKETAIDFNFTISNIKAVTAQANEVPFTFEPSSVTINVDTTQTSINTISPQTDSPQTNPNIYPNPTDGVLNLAFEQEIPQRVRFFDLDGKLVYENLNNQKDILQLEVANWNKGVYLISFQYEGKMIWEKVVVD